MEPMLLKPVGKDYLWGGNRLNEEFNKNISLTPLAETWECSTHPDGISVIANGSYAGEGLDIVLKKHPYYLGEKLAKYGKLPILVKLIDAKINLSLQVHPDDEFARENENDLGKNEMWYVLDASNTASLVHGFSHNVNEKIIRRAIIDGDLDKHLNKVAVKKGDTFYTRAGTIHGIGAGCLIAEIQENSKLTYRVYDYDRIDKNGEKRELHLEKALKVLNMNVEEKYRQRARLIKYYPGCAREILCRCRYFEVEKISITKGVAFTVFEDSFQVLLCVEGDGGIETSESDKPLRFNKGDCLFLPAGLGKCFLIGTCGLLKIRA